MKIKVFEGNKGDCLLVQSADGRHILIDGGLVKTQFGRVDSYSENVAKSLGKLHEDGVPLDLVCVSHIDQDHIGGILKLLDDTFDWRVHEHQIAQGLTVTRPANPRPPDIKELWHNAFHETVNLNRRSVYRAIAAAAPAATVLDTATPRHGEHFFQELATSMSEAVQLSRRIGAAQLAIPLNASFGGKLVRHVRNKAPIRIGTASVHVIGPTGAQLKTLRKKWNAWLESAKGQRQINRIRRSTEEDEQLLKSGDLTTVLQNAFLGPAIGNREDVTEENVASIVLLIEDGSHRFLTTGDARDDDILDGLRASGISDDEGHVHLDAVKIQHHGSENNYSVDFGQRVSADHYIFCGNGQHENPDLQVVDRLIDSRLGPDSRRSPQAPAKRPFTLWFTSDGTTTDANQLHMQAVMKLVEKRRRSSSGVMRAKFSRRPHFTINL